MSPSVPSDMFERALAAFHNAYAPYSGFRVGVCLRGDSGRLFSGANVENLAYPQSQCGEASAVGALASAGDRKILEAVIVTQSETPAPPCGGCLQRLTEFGAPDLVIHLQRPDGAGGAFRLGELMPHAFSPSKFVLPGSADKEPRF